jgi:hypothetical protein
MYTRLLLESLRRGTRRKLLAVSAVALGTFGATALAEVMLSSGDRIAAEMSSYGANLELVPEAGRQTLAVADLPAVRKIFWRNNIVALAPFQEVRVRLGETMAPLVGTWFDHDLEGGWRTGLPRVRPTLRVAGRWPAENGESPELVLGRRLAARVGIVAVRIRRGERLGDLRGRVGDPRPGRVGAREVEDRKAVAAAREGRFGEAVARKSPSGTVREHPQTIAPLGGPLDPRIFFLCRV